MTLNEWIEISEKALKIEQAVNFVVCSSTGAVSTFIGTTRDVFEGKRVVYLEYEAYESMAISELKKISAKIRQKWPGVAKIALLHRTGRVDIGESSVIIAISSPHRKESLEAVEFAIETLKASVPIWKREFYENEPSIWKENCIHSTSSCNR